MITGHKKLEKHKSAEKFCTGFYTLIDDRIKEAMIIERCIVKGTVEWDAVNRLKAGGIVRTAYTEGNTLIMITALGAKRPNFGSVTAGKGAQALKALIVRGDKVYTRWLGLAGASIGAGSCLPQAPGVIASKIIRSTGFGGSNQIEVELVTPKLRRLIIGLDDTDNRFEGATWTLALKLAHELPYGHFIDMKIVQLLPSIEHRTTNCCSTGLSFAIRERDIPAAVRFITRFVTKYTVSNNTAIAVYEGVKVPKKISTFGLHAKNTVLTVTNAMNAAKQNNVRIEVVTGARGAIGALAAIGCFDMGPAAAATLRNGKIP